ncbi:outer membrane protein [Halomonadaceae bacterium KBTZ08]
MRQAFSAVAVVMLVLATPVQAQSYYVGVNGGYTQFRDTRFSQGDEGRTRVTGAYEGGDTASVSIGQAFESGAAVSGRLELEFGLQSDQVDSMVFDNTPNKEPAIDDDPVVDEDTGEVEQEGSRERVRDVSGQSEATFGFANAIGDFTLTDSTALVGGLGFGVGEVTFDTHSANENALGGDKTGGVVMDDSDITYGYQLIGGVAWQPFSMLDLEVSYRYRSWEDISMRSASGVKSKLSVRSHNLIGSMRVRF